MNNNLRPSIQPQKRFRGLAGAIALIQLFDIIIHAISNQLEPIRVASNIVILLWLAVVEVGGFQQLFKWIAVGCIGTFLSLNAIFLATQGLRNPEQEGRVRVLLLVLIILTVVLSSLLTYLYQQGINAHEQT